MKELLEWLKLQNIGMRTYRDFQKRALALRLSEKSNAALARLLADLAGRFCDSYEGEPLPIDTAERAMKHLICLIERAEQSAAGDASERLRLLNEIASVEL